MSTLSGGPGIVTDGLVLSLDAANTKSYPGSGTVWRDISRGGNNGTLVNGLIYETNNLGGIIMDGGNEYIDIPYSPIFDHFKSGNFTVETIVRSDNVVYPRSRHPLKIGHTVHSAATKGWSVGHTACNNYIQVRVSDGINISFINLPHITLAESTYYHRIFTINRLNGCTTSHYLNGMLIGTHNAPLVTGEIYNQNQTSDIGSSGIGFGNVYGWRFIGSINVIKIYNRALSPSEILQNYNATKTRFGL